MNKRNLGKLVADKMGCHQSDVDVKGLERCLILPIRHLNYVNIIKLSDGNHQIEFFYDDGGSYDYTQVIVENYIRR